MLSAPHGDTAPRLAGKLLQRIWKHPNSPSDSRISEKSQDGPARAVDSKSNAKTAVSAAIDASSLSSMSTLSEQSATFPRLHWERVMSETRYGKYADAVESSLVDYVLKQPRAAGVLLDVGCEGGRHAQLFAERGWRVIATDVDAHFLSVCRSRIPESHCVLTAPDSRELPAESASVDVVLCIEVGSVIHADWAVGEFARVLKPGGQVVGVCWNRTSWRGFIYHNLPFSRVQGSHPMVGFPIRYTDFRSDAVQQGFHFERERGFAWGPFRRSSDSPWVPFWATFERLSGLQRLVSTSPMVAFVARKDDRHTDGRF